MISGRASEASSVVRFAEWCAIGIPLVYVASRMLWAVGIPLGISTARMEELDLPGSGSISLVVLSIPALLTAWFTWWFPVRRNMRLPTGLPAIGGFRPGRTTITVTLLVPVLILTYSNIINVLVMTTNLAPSDDMDAMPGWSLWGHLVLFVGWWASLVVVLARFLWSFWFDDSSHSGAE